MTLSIPIRGNQALRLSAFHVSSKFDLRFQCCTDLERTAVHRLETVGDLSWIYDSTDDPFAPIEGTLVTAGVGLSDASNPIIQTAPGSSVVRTQKVRQTHLHLLAARHWPVFGQGSVETRIGLGTTRSRASGLEPMSSAESRPSQRDGTVRLGYSDSFWSPEQTHREGYFRWETFAELARFETSDVHFDSLGLGAGISFRNGWGLIRIQATYEAWSERGGSAFPAPQPGESLRLGR